MRTIVDALDAWAFSQPASLLFEFRNSRGAAVDRHTYRSFRERTAALADHLIETAGLREGDRALLAYPPGLGTVTALVACARVGIIGVPVLLPSSQRAPAWHRLRAIAAHARAAAVLTDTSAVRRLAAFGAVYESSGLARVVSTDGCGDSFATASRKSRPHDVLLLQYTSGSTGSPRGVIVTHENVIANARATLEVPPIAVSWLPQHHDMGLIGYHLYPMLTGGAAYTFAASDFLRRPALWLQTLSDVEGTHSSSPNFGFEYCLREGRITLEELANVDLSSVRVLMNASEPVNPRTMVQFHQRFARLGLRKSSCTAAYGLAENTLTVAHGGAGFLRVRRRSLSDGRVEIVDSNVRDAAEIASCGTPAPTVSVAIRDTLDGRALGALCVGEIEVSGPSVTSGYWRESGQDRSKPASSFEDRGSVLRTGDLGFIHSGELYVCGRIKDLIIISGENFFPADIETAVAAAHAGVRRRGVCAFQTDVGQVVVVAEAARVTSPPVAEEVAETVRRECGLRPDVVAVVAPRTVVKTTSGKIARAPTRALYESGRVTVLTRYEVATAGPSACERGWSWRAELAAIFARHGIRDRTTSLGDLDVDSLTLTHIRLDLEAALERAGLKHLADDVDGQLLQSMSLADLLQALEPLDGDNGSGVAACHAALARIAASVDASVQERLRRDSRQPLAGARARGRSANADGALLTGATGFFGPFVLSELIEQTDLPIFALVRAASGDEARRRITTALRRAGNLKVQRAVDARVTPVCGDLALPRWGLSDAAWADLADRIRRVYHNGACVNYVMTYDAMRAANVGGTRTALRLALDAGAEMHLISSTFIFGWTVTPVLDEADCNAGMHALDFGYAQSKWVAERQAAAARAAGLDVRIYRPSLLSVSSKGVGDPNDVAVRLIAFMMRHRLAVDTPNQLSIVPADIAAHNIVGISLLDEVCAAALHVTADKYYSIADFTRAITEVTGIEFRYHPIPDFINELNGRCSPDDPIYPLLDFFNRSADKIAAMRLKRYRSDAYRAARGRLGTSRSDPSLAEMANLLVAYIDAQGLAGASTSGRRGRRAMSGACGGA